MAKPNKKALLALLIFFAANAKLNCLNIEKAAKAH